MPVTVEQLEEIHAQRKAFARREFDAICAELDAQMAVARELGGIISRSEIQQFLGVSGARVGQIKGRFRTAQVGDAIFFSLADVEGYKRERDKRPKGGRPRKAG